uniref:hypothetical protein n=1 Tax=Sphingomonas aliaeris TaxID=2759526 RepID=UPI001CECF7DA|nr:hypothetical protein [Sphingomonas aliaeris]
MSISGNARSTGCDGSPRISSSVAAASTSQNTVIACGAARATIPAISSASNTPTPFALTTMSAPAASASTPRIAASVAG